MGHVTILEDGDEVEWILDQIGQEADRPVGILLQQIASEFAPEQVGNTEEEVVDDQEVEDEPAEEDFDPAHLDMAELEGMLPPGVDMGQVQKMLSSPRGALLADFGTFCQEHGVEMEAEQGEMNEAMRALHEEWLQTPRDALEGLSLIHI